MPTSAKEEPTTIITATLTAGATITAGVMADITAGIADDVLVLLYDLIAANPF